MDDQHRSIRNCLLKSLIALNDAILINSDIPGAPTLPLHCQLVTTEKAITAIARQIEEN